MGFETYRSTVSAAAAYPQLWRLFLGMLTIIAILIAWVALLLALVNNFAGGPNVAGPMLDDGPLGTLLFLGLIWGLGLGAWAAARIWQKRSLASLIGYPPRALRDFVTASSLTLFIATVTIVVTLPFMDPLTPNMPFSIWITWVPIALVVILFQTGAEELVFRGYLQSQLAARFKSPFVWLVVPSILFGLGHYVPGPTLELGLVYVAVTFFFGLFAADLTARTGTIGAAWGLHFANNVVAILFVVYLGPGSGLGLYHDGPLEDALTLSPLILLDLMFLALVWIVIRRAVRR